MSSWTREISLSARTKVIDRGDQRHGFESASSDSEGECREASEGSTVADSASNGSTRRHRYAAPQAPRRRGSLGTLTDRVAAEPARRFGSGRVNSRSFLGHNGSADDPTLQFDTLDLNVIAGLDAVTRALLEVGRWRRDDGAFLEDIRHVRTHPRTRLDLAGERDRLRSWRWRRRWRRSWGYGRWRVVPAWAVPESGVPESGVPGQAVLELEALALELEQGLVARGFAART